MMRYAFVVFFLLLGVVAFAKSPDPKSKEIELKENTYLETIVGVSLPKLLIKKGKAHVFIKDKFHKNIEGKLAQGRLAEKQSLLGIPLPEDTLITFYRANSAFYAEPPANLRIFDMNVKASDADEDDILLSVYVSDLKNKLGDASIRFHLVDDQEVDGIPIKAKTDFWIRCARLVCAKDEKVVLATQGFLGKAHKFGNYELPAETRFNRDRNGGLSSFSSPKDLVLDGFPIGAYWDDGRKAGVKVVRGKVANFKLSKVHEVKGIKFRPVSFSRYVRGDIYGYPVEGQRFRGALVANHKNGIYVDPKGNVKSARLAEDGLWESVQLKAGDHLYYDNSGKNGVGQLAWIGRYERRPGIHRYYVIDKNYKLRIIQRHQIPLTPHMDPGIWDSKPEITQLEANFEYQKKTFLAGTPLAAYPHPFGKSYVGFPVEGQEFRLYFIEGKRGALKASSKHLMRLGQSGWVYQATLAEAAKLPTLDLKQNDTVFYTGGTIGWLSWVLRNTGEEKEQAYVVARDSNNIEKFALYPIRKSQIPDRFFNDPFKNN